MGLRTGLDEVERRNILPLPGLELRILGRTASSQSLHFCVIQQILLIYFIASCLRNLTIFAYSLYPLCLFCLSLICVHSIYFRSTYINVLYIVGSKLDSWLQMSSVYCSLTYKAIVVCCRVCVLLSFIPCKNDHDDDNQIQKYSHFELNIRQMLQSESSWNNPKLSGEHLLYTLPLTCHV